MKHRAEWTKAVEQRLAKGTPAAVSGHREAPAAHSCSESTAAGRAPNKYGNKRENGYDSLKEGRRHAQLVLLERAGSITELQRQVRFELIPAQYVDGRCVERACHYVADWTYRENGRLTVEDCKGMKTPVYRLKKKLLLLIHGLAIKET